MRTEIDLPFSGPNNKFKCHYTVLGEPLVQKRTVNQPMPKRRQLIIVIINIIIGGGDHSVVTVYHLVGVVVGVFFSILSESRICHTCQYMLLCD